MSMVAFVLIAILIAAVSATLASILVHIIMEEEMKAEDALLPIEIGEVWDDAAK